MSIVMTQQMSGATRELVLEVGDEMNVDNDRPKGLVVHTAIENADGIKIVDVWDSEDDLRAFQENRLAPAMATVAARHGLDLSALPAPTITIDQVFDLR